MQHGPTINGFAAIVHSWDNAGCVGEPQEWRTSQVFAHSKAATCETGRDIRLISIFTKVYNSQWSRL